MGNLCNKEIPHITLSCANTGMVSSCCKATGLEADPVKLYKWMYSNTNDDSMMNWNKSNAWYIEFEQCCEEALHSIELSTESIVQLIIYEWNPMLRQPPQLVFQRQVLSAQL